MTGDAKSQPRPVRPTRVRVDSAIEMAIELHKRGELEEAMMLYGDILDAVPDHPDVLHFLGVARHQFGDSEKALELVARSLELSPGNPAALNNHANILRETGKLEEAEVRYREVLAVAPEHVDTLVNMAVTLRGMKKTDEAREYIDKALAIDPEHPQAWHNLGNVYRDARQFDDALAAYARAEQLAPSTGNATKEIAKILFHSGKAQEAVETLESQLKRDPDDVVARHMIAAFGGADVPDRASDAFVQQTFDTYSSSFDESLARLEYKAPRLVADQVARLSKAAGRALDILDVGCGTGLCGPLVAPVAGRLVGVDLSPGMLRKARRKAVYDELAEGELTAYMQATTSDFDAVLCVDTFVYFGKLDGALEAAFGILRPGGEFIFTVERHTAEEFDGGYRLQHHGRYSHRDDYLRQTVAKAGFEVSRLEQVVPRIESGKPVAGTLVVARKAR